MLGFEAENRLLPDLCVSRVVLHAADCNVMWMHETYGAAHFGKR
jgi:hypothetical protein